MRKFLTSSMAAMTLVLTPPVLAQDADPGDVSAEDAMTPEALSEFAGMMTSLFQTDPLTAEQEARLPAAQAVVGAMMPEGFYGEMMSDMMDKMMRPMMSMFTAPEFILSTRLAVESDAVENLDEASQAEVLAMLDPAYDKRADVIINVLTGNMGEMFAVLEPPMREGLSKAYAVRFDDSQLADIATFFATPTGGIYARESMALFADPQVMQATMQALPAMMGSFGDMESAMAEAMAELPAERAYEDLSDEERSRMAQLLGIEVDELADAVIAPKPMGGDGSSSGM